MIFQKISQHYNKKQLFLGPSKIYHSVMIIFNIMLLFAVLQIGLNISNIVCSFIYTPIPVVVLTFAIFTILLVTATQLLKEQILVRKQEITSWIILGLLICLDLYYIIIGLALLVYMQQVENKDLNLSKNVQSLMYQNGKVKFSGQAWLTLTFYFGNFIFLGFYTRSYYRFFWVNHIVYIYRYLKRKVTILNESLMANLPLIEVTQTVASEKCCLCLQNFNSDEKVTRLHCMHLFHQNCIRIWVVRSNACPLCRKRVVFY